MNLILLRHGKAEDSNPGGDFARELEERGRRQARKAAKALARAKVQPHIVLTSPLVRARQTAEEFCTAGELPGAVIQGWLACGMHPETVLGELAGFSEFETVVIIGHEPDFSRLVEYLLGTGPASVEVKKGALVGLRIAPPSTVCELAFLIPPKFLPNDC